QEAGDLTAQLYANLANPAEFWRTQATPELHLATRLIMLVRDTSGPHGSPDITQTAKALFEFGILDMSGLPDGLRADASTPALLQTVNQVTFPEAMALAARYEARRLQSAGLPYFGAALAASAGLLLASQSPGHAAPLLMEATILLASQPARAADMLSILQISLQVAPEGQKAEISEDVSRLVEAILGKDQDQPVPAGTLRLICSVLIETTIIRQDRGEQEEAFKAYNLVIGLFERADQADPDGSDPMTRLNWGTAYMNRGNVRRALPDPDIDAAIDDYKTGMAMKEALLPEASGILANQIRGDLERGHGNLAAAEKQRSELSPARGSEFGPSGERDRPVLAGQDWRNEAIQSMETRYASAPGPELAFQLAALLIARGDLADRAQISARVQTPHPGWIGDLVQEAGRDFDRAIELMSKHVETGAAGPACDPGQLASAYALRSRQRSSDPDFSVDDQIADVNAALAIWEVPHIRIRNIGWWLDACDSKVRLLMDTGRNDEALSLIQSTLESRMELFLDKTFNGSIEALLTGGFDLANRGAILLARSDKVMDAILLLYHHTDLRSRLLAQAGHGGRADASHIRKLVPAGGALVVPALTDQETAVLVLSDDRRTAKLGFGYWIANNVNVLGLMPITASQGILDGGDTGDWQFLERSVSIAAKSVWRDFVGPVYDALRKDLSLPDTAPLTFITQGMLDYMPLHAAVREVKGDWRFAIEDRVIRYAPTLAALSRMNAAAGSDEADQIAGFFDPLGDLPSARFLEPEKIQAGLGADRLEASIGPDASTSNFTRLLTDWENQDCNVLHLSTHCMFDMQMPGASYLQLCDDTGAPARVEAREIFRLTPVRGLRHVSLASCRSGFPDIGRSSSEPSGLVSAFIHLGAASVFSSLYPILDQPAADLVAALYRRRAEGHDTAEAFRDEIISRLEQVRQAGGQTGEFGESPASGGDKTTRALLAGWRREDPVLPLSWWAGLKPVCPGPERGAPHPG
ncbi:CHAT domain-containing protein, partial [Hyphomonas sp. ND6WE1B]|uniref:CHAT domain-containing protein n=1 Tax=Hyphomonas sp. ND6WE1B TaxID=1848191 RepID=UPI0011125428